jgi:hypothetical protein
LIEDRNRPSAPSYPALAIKMLDGRAVETFSDAFGLYFFISTYERDADRSIFHVRAAGRTAVAILRDVYPFIEGTTKGKQIADVCSRASVAMPASSGDFLRSASQVPDTALATSGRRRREWLLDQTRFDPDSIAWASGLFAAEGYACLTNKTARGRTYEYPTLSITMLDRVAVDMFGNAIGARPYAFTHYQDRKQTCYRVQVTGSAAEASLRAMYPHLRETDKGDQIKDVFGRLRLELLEDGSGRTWPRSNGLSGRALSESHRAAISRGQTERWRRSRDAQ